MAFKTASDHAIGPSGVIALRGTRSRRVSNAGLLSVRRQREWRDRKGDIAVAVDLAPKAEVRAGPARLCLGRSSILHVAF
jgi:hypothetical protein